MVYLLQAKPSQAKPSQAKPNKTYYQMDKSSFSKGGISRLQTPSLVKDSGKGVFCFDRMNRMNSRKPERHWRKIKNKEKGRIGEFLSRMG